LIETYHVYYTKKILLQFIIVVKVHRVFPSSRE